MPAGKYEAYSAQEQGRDRLLRFVKAVEGLKSRRAGAIMTEI